MNRVQTALVALCVLFLAIVPTALADDVCPRGKPGPVDCHDKLASPGQDHFILLVDPGVGEARASYYEPTKLSAGETFVEVAYEDYDGPLGEEVVVAYLACPWDAPEGCTPTEYFVAGHFAPPGHDARAWTASDWRSAGVSYGTRVADHDVAVQAGTFHFLFLQYFYAEAFVDGERYGFFEAVPMP